jgi:hypothetical protein
MLAERQRVQHQQIYETAQTLIRMQELVNTLIDKMGIRDERLKKLGVEEMLKNLDEKRGDKGVSVESVEQFDEDTTPTNFLDQGRKN